MKNTFIKFLWLFRILTIINLLIYSQTNNHFIYVIFIVSLTTWYHLEMRNLVGNYIGPRLNINPNWFWLRQTNLEKTIDNKLKVKKWKKFVPAYEPDEFDLKKYSLDQIVSHMYRAEIDHELMFLLSYVPILFSLLFGDFWIFLLTSLVVSLVDLALVIVQRYNRNRLVRILSKNRK